MKTDISSLLDNNLRIKEFKHQAKILLRQIKTIKPDITLRYCQDLVAQQHGYKHWYEFHTEIKKIYEGQQVSVKNYFYKKMSEAVSLFDYGYSKQLGLNFCLGQEDRLTHTLITGKNRNKFNLHLAKQAIEAHETLIFMDGTGQRDQLLEIINLARKNNREHDILTLNFMTVTQPYFGNKISNTFNPFSSGSSGGLTELIVSLMGYGGVDMWKGRAISLISAIMMALVYMRDQKEILLDVEAIREYLIIDNIIKLYKTRRDFPNHIRNALRAYLVSLPGFQESAPKQNNTVFEHHGHLQIQFTKLLGSLSDSYGYIFNYSPEIHMEHITEKNKIILVHFPCFEKSIDELKILSYLLINSIKMTISSQMQKKSHSNKTTLILDSCPLPRGFAVIPAQARYNNISIVLSYLDNTFNNSDINESMSVQANCNIKVNMNNETDYEIKYKDMKYDLIIKY